MFLVVAGTRPEVIKLAPVVGALRERGHEVVLGVSAQHRELLDQALAVFKLSADLDLDLMRPGQDLTDVTAGVLTGLREPLRRLAPEWVLVQGDTTTVFAAALAAFYAGVPVGHVEAGLRTGDPRNPFPEELNRTLTADLARLHFAPCARARDALRAEGVAAERIHVVGNTAIDALLAVRARGEPDLTPWGLGELPARFVLVTVHRRESFGAPVQAILGGLAELAGAYPEVGFVYPVHPNPNVQGPARAALGGLPNVHLTDPLPYPAFAHLLDRAAFALSDSGGVQEEGPALGTPVLVLRAVTERPEAVEAGGARLIGTERATIVAEASALLDDPDALAALATPRFPYGRGDAAERIVAALEATSGSGRGGTPAGA